MAKFLSKRSTRFVFWVLMAQVVVSFILMGFEIFGVIQLETTEAMLRWVVPLVCTTAFAMVLGELMNPASPSSSHRWKQFLIWGLAGWIAVFVVGQWLIAAGLLRSDNFERGRFTRLSVLSLILLVALASNWLTKRRGRR